MAPAPSGAPGMRRVSLTARGGRGGGGGNGMGEGGGVGAPRGPVFAGAPRQQHEGIGVRQSDHIAFVNPGEAFD